MQEKPWTGSLKELDQFLKNLPTNGTAPRSGYAASYSDRIYWVKGLIRSNVAYIMSFTTKGAKHQYLALCGSVPYAQAPGLVTWEHLKDNNGLVRVLPSNYETNWFVTYVDMFRNKKDLREALLARNVLMTLHRYGTLGLSLVLSTIGKDI